MSSEALIPWFAWLAPRLLLLFGLGFLVANILVTRELVRYHRGGAPGGTGHAALGGLHLCFEVDDVEAAHAALATSGRYHIGPIVRREPYGGRSFYVDDPDGVPVEIEQRDA